MEAPLYNSTGKKTGSIKLPEQVFGVSWNDALIHQVVTSMQANARPPVAHVKERGEVRGGGRKPWKQKGTGRARHGSIRSPIWRGGGVTHGPRNEKNYSRIIPKGMRSKALFMALSQKFKDGEIVFVDSIEMKEPKTALAKKTLIALSGISGFERLATKRTNAALIALSTPSEAIKKSYRNIGSVSCMNVRDLNPVAVLGSSYLILENPETGLKFLESRAVKPVRSGKTDKK